MIDNIRIEDLVEAKLDFHDDSIAVSMMIPVGSKGEFAQYEELIEFGAGTPEYLKAATRNFAEALARAVRERVTREGEVPCVTCTGACCYKFPVVRVYDEDIDRFKEAGLDPDTLVDFYGEGFGGTEREVSWTGGVGQLKFGPGSVSGKQCLSLKKDGCEIYEHRPKVCRQFSPYTCGDTYEEDNTKVNYKKLGRTTLRVIK